MRYAVTALAALVLVPIMLLGAAVAATAILGEWFSFRLFDFSGIGPLDWLFGGPGASPNSFENYVTFMLASVPTFAAFAILNAMWEWARRDAS